VIIKHLTIKKANSTLFFLSKKYSGKKLCVCVKK
jgi:hypothetical protein